MEVGPADISHLIAIVEKENKYEGRIVPFKRFCRYYSPLLLYPSHKQMYALYCFYYAVTIKKMFVNLQSTEEGKRVFEGRYIFRIINSVVEYSKQLAV